MAGTITDIKPQKRSRERVDVYIDGRQAFSLPLAEAVHLRVGQHLSDEELAHWQFRDAYTRARDLALAYVARRPRSTAEVRRYLRQKGFADEVVERVVARLQELAYLDDREFAAYWVEQRATFRPRGRLALQQELREKGVSEALIRDVLQDVDETAGAWKVLQRYLPRWRHLDWPAYRRKAGALLARRGFSYEVIRATLARGWAELHGTAPDVDTIDEGASDLSEDEGP